MKTKHHIVIFHLFFLLAVSAFGQVDPNSKTTAPQKKAALGLTPAQILANIQPGRTFTQKFTLTNSSDTRIRFKCSVGDIWYDENNNPIFGPAGTLQRSAATWIQFTPNEVVVEPQSHAVVKAIISVPQTAVGGYYATPFFEGEAAEQPVLGPVGKHDARGISSIAIRLGGLLMLAVEKTSDYKVEIAGVKATPPTGSSEMEVSLDLINRGNVHAFIKGTFAILDANNKLAGQGKFEDRVYFPAQRKTIKGKWAGTLPPGDYTIIPTLTYDRAGLTPISLTSETLLKVEK